MEQKRPSAMIYARVSSEEQGRGYSITTQIDSARRYCGDKGYTVVGEFTDTHTGTELDRPGINAVLSAARDLRPDVVVIYDVDRLGRELIVQAILERDLTASGARIEYVLGGDTGTPDGELLKMVKGALAVFENRQRRERSLRGKRGRVEAGHPFTPTSRPPYGYDYIAGKHQGAFIINEPEAEIMRQMYQWLITERLSCYQIAKRLSERGVPTRGDTHDVVVKRNGYGQWSGTTVRQLLRNSTYMGEWHYGKRRRRMVNGKKVQVTVPRDEWIAVSVPSIIDANLWHEAQRCLDQNKQRSTRNNTVHEYLLRGMIVCESECGRHWTGYTKAHGAGYYRCSRRTHESWHTGCTVDFTYRQEKIESAVWRAVMDRLKNPAVMIAEIEHRRNEQAHETAQRVRRLKSVEAEIAGIDQKLGALLSKELDGYPAEVIEQQKRALLAQRQDADAARDRLTIEQSTQDIAPGLEAELQALADMIETAEPHMTFADKRHLLEILRVRIDVIDARRVRLSAVVMPDAILTVSC